MVLPKFHPWQPAVCISYLHEFQPFTWARRVPKPPFVSCVDFFRSTLTFFSAHVTAVIDPSSPPRPAASAPPPRQRIWGTEEGARGRPSRPLVLMVARPSDRASHNSHRVCPACRSGGGGGVWAGHTPIFGHRTQPMDRSTTSALLPRIHENTGAK